MLNWVEHEKSFITSGPGHSSENMLFKILHILPTLPVDDRSTPRLRKKEKYWIYQLHSLKLLGLNGFG